MAKVFYPPPNWPKPPRGWSPAGDWRPDAAWGPAPEGWQFWVEEGQQPVSDDDSPPRSSPRTRSTGSSGSRWARLKQVAPNRAQRTADDAPVPGQTEKRIFISYRRSDCQPQANAINDGLRHRLRPARVFMDIDSIPAGVDFAEHIREEIEMCDVVLVLIGDDWISATDQDGRRRIDNPDDFVRLEIENAFAASRVSVVPVLVEGAEMPRGTDLPDSLQRLSRINAIELSDQRWTSDIERLAGEITRLEAYQEERANRARELQDRGLAVAAAEATSPDVQAPSPGESRNLRLADVRVDSIRDVIRSMPASFQTKDVSDHPDARDAHGALADAVNYHAMIGRFLQKNQETLGIAPYGSISDSQGATWRRLESDAVASDLPTEPGPHDVDASVLRLGRSVAERTARLLDTRRKKD
jgi:hypothetical protein